MRMISGILKSLVAALTLAAPVSAQGVVLDDLFTALKQASPPDSEQIVQKIWREWSKSGSPAMDLLLERARRAMEVGDNARAIEHLGALIDHAPDFAEAYNTRATAYYNEGRFGLALDDIRMALALNPRHFGAMTRPWRSSSTTWAGKKRRCMPGARSKGSTRSRKALPRPSKGCRARSREPAYSHRRPASGPARSTRRRRHPETSFRILQSAARASMVVPGAAGGYAGEVAIGRDD